MKTKAEEDNQHSQLPEFPGPFYWKCETSGVLVPAIEAYLHRRVMTPEQIAAMRAYLRQWIFSPVWEQNPHGTDGLEGLRDMVDSLTSQEQIDRWLGRALGVGIDPL